MGQLRPALVRIFVYGGLLLLALTLFPRYVNMMIYPAPAEDVPVVPPAPIEALAITNANGETLSAWFLPCAKADAPVVIFFHGNGQNLGTMLYSGFLHRFGEYQVHLLALDYPGYGNSQGRPSEESLMESGTLAVDWALAHYPDAPKVLMGWSLGAAVAVEMSARFSGQHDGLILLSPWKTLPDVAGAHYPKFLVKFFVSEKYPSDVAASAVEVPSLVIHGEDDTIIPASQGTEIAAILGETGKSQLVIVKDRGHNDLMAAGLTWTHIQHFLAQFGPEAER